MPAPAEADRSGLPGSIARPATPPRSISVRFQAPRNGPGHRCPHGTRGRPRHRVGRERRQDRGCSPQPRPSRGSAHDAEGTRHLEDAGRFEGAGPAARGRPVMSGPGTDSDRASGTGPSSRSAGATSSWSTSASAMPAWYGPSSRANPTVPRPPMVTPAADGQAVRAPCAPTPCAGSPFASATPGSRHATGPSGSRHTSTARRTGPGFRTDHSRRTSTPYASALSVSRIPAGKEERGDPSALDGDALGRPVASLPPEPVGEREGGPVVLDPYAAGVVLADRHDGVIVASPAAPGKSSAAILTRHRAAHYS